MLKSHLNKKVKYSDKIKQNTNQGGKLCVINKSKVQKGVMETDGYFTTHVNPVT